MAPSGSLDRRGRKSPSSCLQLEVVLAGDQRLAENLILEVRALAQRYGLGVPSVRVMRKAAVRPKTKKLAARRDSSSRARRTPSSLRV